MGIIKRMKEPTPRFFRRIRNIGITAATIGGAVITAPVTLPAVVTTVAGYLLVVGTVASAISQTVTEPAKEEQWMEDIRKTEKDR
jgi:uncharacterized membrane protein HdeD (DUF308 family)